MGSTFKDKLKKSSRWLGYSSLLLTFFLAGCGETTPTPWDDSVLKQIQFTFEDQDNDRKEIQGDLSLTLPAELKLEGITQFVLYWANQGDAAGKGEMLTEIAVADIKQAGVLYNFPENTKMKGDYVLLYLKNEKVTEGEKENFSGLPLEIKDAFDKPEPIEGTLSFEDKDLYKNRLGGPITLDPVPEGENIAEFVFYWADSKDGKPGKQIGSMSKPDVEGNVIYNFDKQTDIAGSWVQLYLKNEKGEVFSSLSVAAKDLWITPPKALKAGNLFFDDVDVDPNEVQGEVFLKPYPGAQDFDEFVLYWAETRPTASTADSMKGTEAFARKRAEVENRKVADLAENTKMEGMYLMLYLRNAGGETYSNVYTRVKDLVSPDAQSDMGGQYSGAPIRLKDVRFAFDRSVLTSEFKEMLRESVKNLESTAKVNIVVAGHADERGSNEYNLALGERRALAVKRYLGALGVSPDQIKIVSYGEENPLDPGHTEAAWAVNRRAETEIYIGQDKQK